jgi:hypothetical protein
VGKHRADDTGRGRSAVAVMDHTTTLGTNGGEDAGLPPVGRGVFVSHDGEERMAYRDGNGLWRNYNNGDLLKGEVQWPHDGWVARVTLLPDSARQSVSQGPRPEG